MWVETTSSLLPKLGPFNVFDLLIHHEGRHTVGVEIVSPSQPERGPFNVFDLLVHHIGRHAVRIECVALRPPILGTFSILDFLFLGPPLSLSRPKSTEDANKSNKYYSV